MGSICSSSEPVVDVPPNPSTTINTANALTTVPYIVVSSVSLSRKIADENMHLSVTNTASKSSLSAPKPSSYYRSLSSTRRRKKSSITPETASRDTIVFEDDEHKHRIEVEIQNKDVVPYLSLQDSFSRLPNTHTMDSRMSSLVSLAESRDDVSLTSELLLPESIRRSASEAANVELEPQCCSHNHTTSQLSISDSELTEPNTRSDSIKVNRLKSESSNQGNEISWDSLSMKQQLLNAKSISAMDLIQQYKENVDVEQDLLPPDDVNVWKLFESRADSGRSSTTEEEQDEATLKELIRTKLELLSIYAPMDGPTMQTRVSSIANEIIVIYEKLTNHRLQVDRSEKEIISNIDAIRSYQDIKHYIYLMR